MSQDSITEYTLAQRSIILLSKSSGNPVFRFKLVNSPLVCHHRADVHASTPQPARVGTELGCFPVAASVVRYNLFCVV